jgi:hypothetical protein
MNFYFNADPDPAFHPNADPDPAAVREHVPIASPFTFVWDSLANADFKLT